MMGTYAAGGVLAVALVGQTGMEQLAQAMASDVTMTDVVNQAQQLTGLGISVTDGGVIIATLVFAMKVIDNNKGLFVTFNDALRRILKLPPSHPPHPPTQP
jgi:hypothetical protein